MRTAAVNGTAIGVAGVLAAAVLLFGVLAGRRPSGSVVSPGPAASDAGRLAFDQHCGACHEGATLAAGRGLLAGDDGPLLAFLADHGDASATDDRAIVAYLRRLAAP